MAITVRGICIRLIMPSIMRAPLEAVKAINGALLQHGELRRRKTPADRGTHRAADEFEFHGSYHGLLAVDLAVGDDNRVVEMGLVPRFLQAISVALGIAKAQVDPLRPWAVQLV